MIVREQPLHLRVSQDRLQETRGDVAFQQSVAVRNWPGQLGE
jgi:hypothetical protein